MFRRPVIVLHPEQVRDAERHGLLQGLRRSACDLRVMEKLGASIPLDQWLAEQTDKKSESSPTQP